MSDSSVEFCLEAWVYSPMCEVTLESDDFGTLQSAVEAWCAFFRKAEREGRTPPETEVRAFMEAQPLKPSSVMCYS